jgi:putative flavoprotein involved in K+ transport
MAFDLQYTQTFSQRGQLTADANPMSQHTTKHAEIYSAIIIGAGQAGVALSHCLQQRGVTHLVLEKDRPFAEWYDRRWDSFAMNTPNWMNVLPGEQQPFAPQAGRKDFGTLKDAQEYFEAYLRVARPPLRIEEVKSVGVNRDVSWQVTTNRGIYNTDNIAICTGHARHKKIPPMADDVPGHVPQLHSSEYRNPMQIETAHVLVVGSGSSGVQICHELAACDRFDTVYLAGSGNFTLPWSILGISTYSLMRALGVFKITRDSWLGRMMFPRLLKKGDPATPPSPRRLDKNYGVRRFGRVSAANCTEIHCSDGQVIPTQDLSVVWCTGFRASYDFLDVYVRDGVLDKDGVPIHQRGVVAKAPGLYFVGLRFQHTFVSQDICGVGQDAQYVAEQIVARSVGVARGGSGWISPNPAA